MVHRGAAPTPAQAPTQSLSEGVRGTGAGGAVTMERSDDERQKYPDRINLDRKGLHGATLVQSLLIYASDKTFCYQRGGGLMTFN